MPSTTSSGASSLGLVETRTVTLFDERDPLVLASGATLAPVEVAYETYGTLDETRSNAVYVCHALTGDAHAAGYHDGSARPGWWDSMSENSMEPNPSSQTNLDGRVVLSYNTLAAGHKLIVWLYFQVNPTNVGKRSEDVELNDGSHPITSVHRSLTIFP